jgi:hypothetical protein
MEEFIHVPQGCYAELGRTTSDNIIGLLTYGMATCSHIIIANKKTGFIALCHADNTTNLEDDNSGIPAWIRKACPDQDYSQLIINVGEEQGKPSFIVEENPELTNDNSYYEQARRSVEKVIINASERPNITQQPENGILILRSNYVVEKIEGYQEFEINEEIPERFKNAKIKKIKDEYNREIGGSINNARGRAISKSLENTKLPPVCVFRNSSFLSVPEMQKENNFINFNRVITNKGVDTDSSPSSSDRDSFGSDSKSSGINDSNDLSSNSIHNKSAKATSKPNVDRMIEGLTNHSNSSPSGSLHANANSKIMINKSSTKSLTFNHRMRNRYR